MGNKQILVVIGATGAQGGGLVRAIQSDAGSPFTARAVTRKPASDKARALAALGAEIVAADADEPASLESAFDGAHGAFVVTNFWEHFSPERELAQAQAMAEACGRAGLKHVVWSTLEDTRRTVPIDDARLPTLRDKYKVPHFDAKGEADAYFAALPTSYLLAAFYWDNFIYFGAGPRPAADGSLVLALPLGDQKLPGIAAEDIGRCAYGIFTRGESAIGQRFGIAGDVLTGEEMAAKMGGALGRPVGFQNVPFDVYRGLGFPGADDMGNMFEYQALLGGAFLSARDPQLARQLNPALQDFDAWLAAHAGRIPLG